MKLISIWIVFCILIIGTTSLKANSFCKMNQLKCTGYLEQDIGYTEKCVKIPCQDPLSYQCHGSYCAFDKKKCDQLKTTVNWIERIESTNKSMYNIRMNKFQKFVSTFKNCHIKYEFNSTDACIRTQNCAIRTGNAWKKILRWKICPCDGQHSYECGVGFCTVDNFACNSLMSMESGSLILFKKC